MHAIACAAARPLLALPLRNVQRPGEQPQVEALALVRLGPAFFLAVVDGEDVLADADVRKYRAPGACRTCTCACTCACACKVPGAIYISLDTGGLRLHFSSPPKAKLLSLGLPGG